MEREGGKGKEKERRGKEGRGEERRGEGRRGGERKGRGFSTQLAFFLVLGYDFPIYSIHTLSVGLCASILYVFPTTRKKEREIKKRRRGKGRKVQEKRACES